MYVRCMSDVRQMYSGKGNRMDEHAKREMPQYRCSEVVGALKIARVELTGNGARLHFESSGFDPIEVVSTWVINNHPRAGKYCLAHKSGFYTCALPLAFEAGYSLID